MRFTSALLLLSSGCLVQGWGELGHRTVAYLAEKYLTDDAATLVEDLLKNDRGWDISDGALWADTVKRKRGYNFTGPWHYIDAKDSPPRRCGVEYNRDCQPKKGCVVSAITNMTARIADTSLPRTQQKEALMYLLHFIGDIHQPLHTEDLDRGGNDLFAWFDKAHSSKKDNLHHIWDVNILHKARGLPKSASDDVVLKKAAKKWAAELFDASNTMAAECKDTAKAEKCALAWAGESNAFICTYVLAPGVDWIEDNSTDLAGEYYVGAVPVVNHLVAKAGLRLGAWLNALAAELTRAGFVVQERMEM